MSDNEIQNENETTKKTFSEETIKLRDDIAGKLGEADEMPLLLIASIIEQLGKDFALELLADTETIEAHGGIQTLDGKRRRSKGGVYFHLAKGRMVFEERQKIFPSRQERERAIVPTKPIFDWERRGKLIEKMVEKQGRAHTALTSIIGKPEEVIPHTGYVEIKMRHLVRNASLPRGVPLPPDESPLHTAFVTEKQWKRVEDQLSDRVLVVRGELASRPDDDSKLVLYVSQVVTRRMETRDESDEDDGDFEGDEHFDAEDDE